MRMNLSNKKVVFRSVAAWLLATPAAWVSCQALPGSTTVSDGTPEVTLSPFTVIGSEAAAFELGAAGTYLSPELLQRFDFGNINSVLQQAPGVYVRDEDGYGLFPNISVRGTNTNRSAKVTLLEDGILTAPAPYSDPAAYYSPTAGRMHAFEVLKGSSQILYGPLTTGGVVNYVSTPIPSTTSGQLKASYGSHDHVTVHAWAGGEWATSVGRVAALAELYHEQTDGFRTIQPSTGGSFAGSGDTGFDRTDLMAKVRLTPDWLAANSFEVKVGYTSLNANETYLGLTEADLAADPNQRYAATAIDVIPTEQFRTSLTHRAEELIDGLTLTTSAYYSYFTRDWFKLDQVNGTTPARTLLTAPGLLRGDAPANFRFTSNDRQYEMLGLQTKADYQFTTGELQHALEAGARLHWDEASRDHDRSTYNGVFAGDFLNPVITKADNRTSQTTALALYARDSATWGRLTVSPGLRFEQIWWDYVRRDGTAVDASGDYSVWAPGLGLNYRLSDQAFLFGGYHRGFAIPSPSGRNNGFTEEISDSFELGLRYQAKNSFYGEVVGFYTHFSDLLVEDSIAGGPGNGNFGAVNSLGVEILAGADLGQLFGLNFGLPVRAAFTYTSATLDGDSASNNAESIFAGGRDGNQIPYVPVYQLNLSAGVEIQQFRAYANLTWVDERYADASNSGLQVNGSGAPDARFGRLDAYTTVDLSAFYQVTSQVEVFAKASNVFDETYIASRIPLGPRAGPPRLLTGGVTIRF